MARPPLGLKARLLAVVLGFALVAILVWLAVIAVQRLVAGPVPRVDDGFDDELDLGAYVDSLPPVDAPRRPIFADKELGAPFMSDEALTSVVVPPSVFTPPEPEPVLVLDEPEAAPEPVFMREAPEPVVEIAETLPESETLPEPVETTVARESILAAPLDVAEFNLPPVEDEPALIAGESSIDTLIRRLEAGVARRAGPPPPGSPSPAANPVAANPVGAMRDWMVGSREAEGDNDGGSLRAFDTLQRLAARRIAG